LEAFDEGNRRGMVVRFPDETEQEVEVLDAGKEASG